MKLSLICIGLFALCGCRTANDAAVQNQIHNLSAAVTDLTHRVDDIERAQYSLPPSANLLTRNDLMPIELQIWTLYRSETNLEMTVDARHDPPKPK